MSDVRPRHSLCRSRRTVENLGKLQVRLIHEKLGVGIAWSYADAQFLMYWTDLYRATPSPYYFLYIIASYFCHKSSIFILNNKILLQSKLWVHIFGMTIYINPHWNISATFRVIAPHYGILPFTSLQLNDAIIRPKIYYKLNSLLPIHQLLPYHTPQHKHSSPIYLLNTTTPSTCDSP